MKKRIFDMFGAFFLLLILSPLFIFLVLINYFNIGAPVFFTQFRPGKNDTLFKIIKFRTMRNAFNFDGTPLPDGQRLTKFGKFLRSTSLDELPELWNVVKGDMSLVGPRPLLTEYLPLYSEDQKRRHDVRPGITGWAQVNGRNALTWEEKFALDLWYIENQSLWLDLKILCLTIKKVIFRENISAENHVTIEKFKGSAL